MDHLKDLTRIELENMIKSQNSTIERLCSQVTKDISIIKNNNNKLEKKIKLFEDITKDFNLKVYVIKIIMKFFREMQITKGFNVHPYVHGSFVRQLVELPFWMDKIEMSNPIGRDIDMILNIPDANIAKEAINFFIKNYSKSNQDHILIIEKKECTIPEIVDSNTKPKKNYTPGILGLQNIPHYKFKINYIGYTIELDIMAYSPTYNKLWSSIDFDVNALKLNENGLSIGEFGSVFFLDNIKNKIADSKINIQTLQETAFLKPNLYKSLFTQILFYLTERLKILSEGYKIKSKTLLPEIKVITTDTGECPFIRLKNKSWISLIEFAESIAKNKVIELDLSTKIIDLNLKTKYISDENIEKVRKIIRTQCGQIKGNDSYAYKCYAYDSL